jgi:hypothetical protein
LSHLLLASFSLFLSSLIKSMFLFPH